MPSLFLNLKYLACISLAFCAITNPLYAIAQEIQQRSDLSTKDRLQTSATNIIIPQARSTGSAVTVNRVKVNVTILQQVATTTLDVFLTNSDSRQQAAEMLIPVPDGVTIRSFTFAGSSSLPSARLLPKAQA